MKRLATVILSVLLALFASQQVSAQYFNHLSLGVTAGLDGAGLQLAAPLGGQFQVRAGYSMLSPIWKYSQTIDLTRFDVKGVDALDAQVAANLGGANLQIDWHPGRGVFFFSAGMYASSPNLVTVQNKEPFLEKEDWCTLGVSAGNKMFTTDENGILRLNLTALPVRPYFGLGIGNAVKSDRRVTFMFEFGACYTGGLSLTAMGENTDTFEKGLLPITSADLNNEDMGIIDYMSKIPVLPMLKFGLFVRLF